MTKSQKMPKERLQQRWVAAERGNWKQHFLSTLKLWFWMALIGAGLFIITFNLWSTQEALGIVLKAIMNLFV